MTCRQFLREKLPALLLVAAGVGFACVVLSAYGMNRMALAFVALCVILSFAAGLVLEYIKKKRFYDCVLLQLKGLDQLSLISELIEEPDFIEGKILYQMAERMGKEQLREIATYRKQQQEYREYIEAWVHEIKTPIASSRLIAENNPTPATKSMLQELSRIEGYIEQALYYSKISCFEKDYVIRELSLRSAVIDTVKKHAMQLISAGVSVEMEDLEIMVYADAKWLDFILGQLIANAVKYQAKQLRFSASQAKKSVTLRIWDNGIGIPREDLCRVFEKGYTGKNGRLAKSTGIGLYLCDQLCRKQGMAVSVDSKVGENTSFYLIFPVGGHVNLAD